ncbi:MAG: 4a-hydroxytetrahydrobiopterin dehydratase [Acidimicrobiia bacterium]|nr:4a-hydroxytetrahydrobiopterin dehydratase [Acidimicrobiia bacterium]
MAEPATDSEIRAALAGLPGWERDGDMIRKEYERESFPDAVAFVVRVGFLAEQVDHHPDIDVRWRKVALALSTHSAGGLTVKDFELARRIEALA